jgi:ABC-type transporter Mla MlaB component
MTEAPGCLDHQAKPGVQHIRLSGSLTMESVGAMYRSLKPFEDGASLTLDAGAVTTADSSALALMTTLIRSARSRNMRVIVASLPVALSSIVAIYGLQAILSPTDV